MDGTAVGDAPDQTLISWKDPLFLASFPLANAHVAMDYFTMSSFYDKSCNNEILRMQHRFNAGPMDLHKFERDLTSMTGLEYQVLRHEAPRLFIIAKQHRYTPDLSEAVAHYYILDGTIFQAPSLLHILQARLLASLYFTVESLSESFSEIVWSSNVGYFWRKDAEYYDKLTLKRARHILKRSQRAKKVGGASEKRAFSQYSLNVFGDCVDQVVRQANATQLEMEESARGPEYTHNNLALSNVKTNRSLSVYSVDGSQTLETSSPPLLKASTSSKRKLSLLTAGTLQEDSDSVSSLPAVKRIKTESLD